MVFDIKESTTAEELANFAVMEVHNVTASTKEFTIRDLFVGYKWDAIDPDTRKLAERLFYQKIHTPIQIIDAGFTDDKQRIYRIV